MKGADRIFVPMEVIAHSPRRASLTTARGGFTLVETVVAALLLAAGILLVLGADRNARALGARADQRVRAVEAAASNLDSARGRCGGGVPSAAVAATADAPFAGGVVHVETVLACGGP